MTGTPSLILAEAAQACRDGLPAIHVLSASLNSAQIGAAFRLVERSGITLIGRAEQAVNEVFANGAFDFTAGQSANEQALHAIADFDDLDSTLGRWLQPRPDPVSQVQLGYWLMSVFLEGLDLRQTALLTRFLIGRGVDRPISKARRSVRRYPTGGVSEKQALILPAFLRCLADQLNFCSSFLVARRLAHTGGTQDKLSVLPGIRMAPFDRLRSWDGVTPPVQYFSAGLDFCPRDAMLYRLRSDTGTVSEPGLMAASIMSKQIAFPADVIVLDVLFNGVAFLRSRAEAERFTTLCREIGQQHGVQVHPYFRESNGTNARCIGNILEICEAATSLSNARNSDVTLGALDYELKLAVEFMRLFASRLGIDPEQMEYACLNALRDGRVFDSLLKLWSEHGVAADFLEHIKADPRSALLQDLITTDVQASRSGIVADWNVTALADFANHTLNAYRSPPDGEVEVAIKGGIEISIRQGQVVDQGQTLAKLYCEHQLTEESASSIEALFRIEPVCRNNPD